MCRWLFILVALIGLALPAQAITPAQKGATLPKNWLSYLQPNLLLSPTTFSNSPTWATSNLTLSSKQNVAPRSDAWKFQATTTGTLRNLQQGTGQANNSVYRFCVIAHAGTVSWIIISSLANTGADGAVWFNLATGVAGTVQGAGVSAAPSVALGSGWFLLCTNTATTTVTNNNVRIYIADNDNDITVTAGDNIYVLGAQLVKR